MARAPSRPTMRDLLAKRNTHDVIIDKMECAHSSPRYFRSRSRARCDRNRASHNSRRESSTAEPSAADRRSPVSDRPSERRSIHSRPSGLSITSTTGLPGTWRWRGQARCAACARRAPVLADCDAPPPSRPRSRRGGNGRSPDGDN